MSKSHDEAERHTSTDTIRYVISFVGILCVLASVYRAEIIPNPKKIYQKIVAGADKK